MWSISVEWRIYFLFPFFVWVWRKLHVGGLLFVGLLISIVASLIGIVGSDGILYRIRAPFYILLFAIGMVVSLLVYSPTRSDRSKLISVAALLAGAAALRLLFLRYSGPLGAPIVVSAFDDTIVGLVSAACIGYCAIRPRAALARLLAWRPLVFVGTFAYSIYLVHYPFLQCLWQLFKFLGLPDEVAFGVGLAAGVPLIVGIAYVFFWYCERPFLKRKEPARAQS
jgi:peptidoglycan/LPS O-acetylase OafA/YrhL